MKKFMLLIASFFFALILAELFVKFVIGYPAAGIQKKIWIAEYGWMNIYKPDSKYWNVEGGNRVFKRNNIGLTGINVFTKKETKNIFVLGTSSVNAMQIEPELIASSHFQKMLNSSSDEYNVLNLGQGGCDPFILIKRAEYFEKKYKPFVILLVLTTSYEKRLQKYVEIGKFDFLKTNKKKATFFIYMKDGLRNISSFFNLTYGAIVRFIKKKRPVRQSEQDRMVVTDKLLDVLLLYKKRFGEKFILVSFIADKLFNYQLSKFSGSKKILFFSEMIKVPENMLHGNGHLNKIGNKKLGELLFRAFMKWKSVKNG